MYARAFLGLLGALALAAAFIAGRQWDAAQDARQAAQAERQTEDRIDAVDDDIGLSRQLDRLCGRLGLGECPVPGDFGWPDAP